MLALSMAGLLLLALGAQAPATPSGRDAAPGPQAVAQATVTAEAVAGASQSVDDETARLRAALSAPRPFTAPARNPFTFHRPVARAPEPARGTTAAPAGSPASPVPAAAPRPPAPTLVAIVADGRAGGVVRTAMLSFDGETAIVAVGETFGTFRVRAITDATVELVDLAAPAHAALTLSIR